MEQIRLNFAGGRGHLTVSQLNAAIRETLNATFESIWVQGEISGCKTFSSGHCYFTLKDRTSQIRCVCFRNDLRFLKVKPADGLAVLARGRLDVYEARGEYQFLVEAMQPFGQANLHAAFEELKKKLAAEGLFEQSRKRTLPRYPRRIGLITSPRGAVIRDMVSILQRRYPGIHIRLFPAQVQGVGSVESLVTALRLMGRAAWADVIIVARGGGSVEDLWSFNEEVVARAIVASPVPVISAVGHETDFTIADFVADLRAPTPSAAAELAVPNKADLMEQMASLERHLVRATRFRFTRLNAALNQRGMDRAASTVHRMIGRRAQRVDELDYRMRGRVVGAVHALERRLADLGKRLERQSPAARLAEAHRRLDGLAARLPHAIKLRLNDKHRRLDRLAAAIEQLSPLRVLDRGYAIVQAADGHVVRSAAETNVGDAVNIRLGDGGLAATVTATKPK